METPCAEDTAYLCAVESPIPNSFFVHVSIPHFPNLSFNSLLDCGSSHCFLDEHFAHSNYFPITQISPMKLSVWKSSLITEKKPQLDWIWTDQNCKSRELVKTVTAVRSMVHHNSERFKTTLRLV